jgi:hypothetical protein
MLQFYIKLSGKSVPLQTHFSKLIAVTQKAVGTPCFLPYVAMFKNLFLSSQPKRKQALLESNLPAIRLMATIIGQCDYHHAAFYII